MAPEKYLFEVPIYRVARDKFSDQYDADLEKHFSRMWPGKGRAAASQELQKSIEQHFWERYGMPWRYNQVAGWIRIYLLGSQVRGELWFTDAKRLVRRSSPHHIRFQGKAFELPTFASDTSEQILAQIRSDVVSSVNEIGHRNLAVDLECFDNIALLIDWRALIHDATN